MKKQIRKIGVLICMLMGFGTLVQAQILNPVTWTYSSRKISDSSFELVLVARIQKGWHIYAQQAGDGPIPTSFSFKFPSGIEPTGGVQELGKEIKKFDKVFNSELRYYKDSVAFIQHVHGFSPKPVTGTLEFMVCNDENCLPPKDINFQISLGPEKGVAPTTPKNSGSNSNVQSQVSSNLSQSDNAAGKSMAWIFFACFAGGLLALVTPCVFSMVPITVSFFTKTAKSRKMAVRYALVYSLSIIFIYTFLGFLITLFFGASALNQLASNFWANLIFFIIFLLFGLSFLGAFELNLPSSWATKADRHAGLGSYLGIFFMALTLTIVSFSCTGPIIGNLLVLAANGGKQGPLIGMFGFSLALAIPFAVFALFPGLLHRFAKSGSWLNAVKVVLGLLELALALKFLSNVDMSYHWGILSREWFLAIWIVIFVLIGIYLLGFVRFTEDDRISHVSVVRLILAILSLAFSIYLVPGMFGAELKGPVAGFLPNYDSITFPSGQHASQPSHYGAYEPRKFTSIFSASTPKGYHAFYDYKEAIEAAKQLKKPLMIDFTGWSCVNCRKMEAEVWTDPNVQQEINSNFVLLQLYTDDKTPIPDSSSYYSKILETRINTLGLLNTDFEAVHFNRNTQPYYVLLDQDGHMLNARGYSYDPDPSHFLNFLKAADQKYHAENP